MSRPRPGTKLYATAFSRIHCEGDLVGEVLRTEDNICFYRRKDGNTDQFIWRFSHGEPLNRNVTWEGK